MLIAPLSTEYHLHGAGITDEPSFWAELGRAVGAPDGYYGRNLDALADCLRGGFTPEPPFTLVWENAMDSAQSLTRRLPADDGVDRAYFDAILDVLRQGGVVVRLR